MSKTTRQQKLGELFIFKNGRGFGKDEWSASGLPIIRIQNLNREDAAFNYYSGEYSPDILVKQGDLLFSWSGTVGSSFGPHIWEKGDGLLNQHIFKISIRDEIDKKYAYYALSHITSAIEAAVSGAVGLVHITKEKLTEFTIPVPLTVEQQRIVAILDKAFDGIAIARANTEKNLQNARALFESHIQSIFSGRGKGWMERPLSELCNIKHGYAFEGEFFSNKGEYVLLTPGNFYEKGGYRDRGEKQKYYTGDIPRDYVLKKGDLLVAMTEQAAGLLGSPILVPEPDRFLHNQRLGLVIKKPDAPWVNEFFFHVFNTQAVRKAIHGSASGVKVRHTSPTKIGEVVVEFPTSVSEQRKIVSVLAGIDEETKRLESLYQRKLAALDELKKSLLHNAFSGEL